jgi:GTP-binding protein EngB required for normal cell division
MSLSCPVQTLPGGVIAVFGNTGVGKSRLIGTLLGDGTIAPYSSGRPATRGIVECRRPGVPLCFKDSAGFENLNKEDTFQKVQQSIGRDSASLDLDNQCYVGILCIAEPGARIQDSDSEMVSLLHRLHIPAVIVLTKAYQERSEAEGFPDEVKRRFPKIRVVRVNVTRNFGLDKLVRVLAEKIQIGRGEVLSRIQSNLALIPRRILCGHVHEIELASLHKPRRICLARFPSLVHQSRSFMPTRSKSL